jgi:hypothetical protein
MTPDDLERIAELVAAETPTAKAAERPPAACRLEVVGCNE